MESEINIENLPDHVLEEIFSYIPKKENLRLVSKRFWDIVNFSPKLMSKFTLYINRIYREDINNFRGRYQNLKFYDLDSSDVEFVKQYKWKQSVNSIHFIIHDEDTLVDKFEMFKSIIFEFDHLLDIHVDCHISSFPYLKYSSEEFRNIRSLKIKTTNTSILPLFRNAINLKKLDIYSFHGIDFTQLMNFQLKELHIKVLMSGIPNSALSIFHEFLETQSSTLTILKINCSNILNDIIHKLPNLEVLHLELSHEDYINDEWLLPNDKLKELAIINTYLFNGRLLEQILKHYRNVEILYISVDETINVEHEMRLTNIKHLTVTEKSFGVLKYLRSDNLKSLTLLGEKIGKFNDIPKDILSKVETLKVNHMENLEFLNNFPDLRHLSICNGSHNETLLNNVLESSNLKSLNLYEYNWKLSVSPQEFLSQKGYLDTIIKLRDSSYNMLDETDMKILEDVYNYFKDDEFFYYGEFL